MLKNKLIQKNPEIEYKFKLYFNYSFLLTNITSRFCYRTVRIIQEKECIFKDFFLEEEILFIFLDFLVYSTGVSFV